RPGDERIGDPRSAPEHAVVLAEEDLGILRVREGAETRIAAEERRRPLPGRAARMLELVAGDLHRLLPLRLGREALPGPAGVRLGLVERDVQDGLARSRLAVA